MLMKNGDVKIFSSLDVQHNTIQIVLYGFSGCVILVDGSEQNEFCPKCHNLKKETFCRQSRFICITALA